MKPPAIFLKGSRTPALPIAPGILLAAPTFRGARSAWMHGVLAIEDDRPGSAAEWARALFVLAVTERGCQPQIAALTSGHAPRSARFIDSGFGLLYLPFHFDLAATLRYPLQPEPTWVHVSAQDLCSESRRLPPGTGGAIEAPSTAVDALILAYTHAREGDSAAATAAFGDALQLDALRGDLDGAHLFTAACVAAERIDPSAPADDPRAAQQSQVAAAWLADDLQRRAARLARIAIELVGGDDTTRAPLLAEQASLARHFAELPEEPRLAALRTRPEYAAIFRGAASR